MFDIRTLRYGCILLFLDVNRTIANYTLLTETMAIVNTYNEKYVQTT